MNCPKCDSPTTCYGSESFGTSRRRYRRCTECDHRFTSYEEAGGAPVRRHVPRPADGPANDDRPGRKVPGAAGGGR
jgi:hypothetical protein